MSNQNDEISAEKVRKRLKVGKVPSLIDVREDEEVESGKIPEARHIRMSEVPERLDELDKDQEHIIVCRSGNRSGQVAKFLQSEGYDAINMAGGMIAWDGDVVSD